MRRTSVSAVAAGAVMLVTGATVALAQDAARAVSGGGISVPGWQGKIDASGRIVVWFDCGESTSRDTSAGVVCAVLKRGVGFL